jgi:ABC-2 type transport system ATP-binding protein
MDALTEKSVTPDRGFGAIGLTRRFGSRLAVENVTFDVAPGDVFALLGPNGAGKTTTMRLLAGLIAPSSGTVRIGNDTLDRGNASRLRARIGFLTEAPGLWDQLTVRLNLTTYARLFGLPNPAKAVDAVLALFDIRDRAGDLAGTLSKGLRQRVALARTLLHDPGIVLLDEPTSGLDPESARDVRQLVQRLRDERRSILLSTHNLDEVERLATRVAVLRQSLIAVDTPDALRRRLFGMRVRVALRSDLPRFIGLIRSSGHEVREEADAMFVALGGPGHAFADTPGLVRYLVAHGADIETVIVEEPTLEDVYLRLLGRDQ